MSGRRVSRLSPGRCARPRSTWEVLAQTESVFALSNGHIGLRANLDEGEPVGLPGTYLNSFYELRPLPHAEAGYGYPESGQTIVNVTNGKIIRLLVDDEPLDVRYGHLLAHERELDLRAGDAATPRGVAFAGRRGGACLARRGSSRSSSARPQRSCTRSSRSRGRCASSSSRSSWRTSLRLRASKTRAPPRRWSRRSSPRSSSTMTPRVVLVHSTRSSKLGMAAGMDHLIEGPAGTDTAAESAGGPRTGHRCG